MVHRSERRTNRHLAVLALLLPPLLSACDYDPALRPGTWLPSGVNDANLAAMVANPADLYGNPGSRFSRGSAAAPAVNRLLNDKAKAINATSTTGGG